MMRFDSARQSRRVAFSYCLAFVFIIWLSATASAAPQITNISLRGLRSAATTTLTIYAASVPATDRAAADIMGHLLDGQQHRGRRPARKGARSGS